MATAKYEDRDGNFPHNTVLRKHVVVQEYPQYGWIIFPHNTVLRKPDKMHAYHLGERIFPHNTVLRKQRKSENAEEGEEDLSTQHCSTETRSQFSELWEPGPLSTQHCSTETKRVRRLRVREAQLSTQHCSTETFMFPRASYVVNAFHTTLFYGNELIPKSQFYDGIAFPHNTVLRKLRGDELVIKKVRVLSTQHCSTET